MVVGKESCPSKKTLHSVDDSNDFTSAIQKRSQVTISHRVVQTERTSIDHSLDRKGRQQGDFEGSVSNKGEESIEYLESRVGELKKNFEALLADAVAAHQNVEEAFVDGLELPVASLRNQARQADDKMLAAHDTLTQKLIKLESKLQEKVNGLKLKAAETGERTNAALDEAKEKWDKWQKELQDVRQVVRDQLQAWAAVLKSRASTVQTQIQSLTAAAQAARVAAEVALAALSNEIVDASTQVLIDAAAAAEEQRVQTMTLLSGVVLDLRQNAEQFQNQFEELKDTADDYNAKMEEARDDAVNGVNAAVLAAKEEWTNILASKKTAAETLAASVHTSLETLYNQTGSIDDFIQEQLNVAVSELQSEFDLLVENVDAVKSEIEQAAEGAKDQLEQKKVGLETAARKVEVSLKEGVRDLQELVIAKIETQVSRASQTAREAKMMADEARKALEAASGEAMVALEAAADQLKIAAMEADSAKLALEAQLVQAKADGEKIQNELKNVLDEAFDTAKTHIHDAVLILGDLFNGFNGLR